jgi:16S rRNA (cytosine1402-N4)-methyltransferase
MHSPPPPMTKTYHDPVMLQESLEHLRIRPNGIYVDATYGGGGHSRGILSLLAEKGKLYAFDQDKDALQNVLEDKRLIFIQSNFSNLERYLEFYGEKGVDGILADLGVSSFQFDTGERGFSIRFEGPLDMRMNVDAELTAADILNKYSKEQLSFIFREYGEIRQTGKLVFQIIQKRTEQEFSTTLQLIQLAEGLCKPQEKNQFLSKVFQALRIEVNNEIEVLKQFLIQACKSLKPGGRLVVISYHSGEDRLVKNFFASGNFEGRLEKDLYGNIIRPLNPELRKPLIPSSEELERNNRSRSGKLRVAQKNLAA